MRKLFSLVLAFAITAIIANVSFAAFSVVGTPQKKTAKVQFASAGTFTWSVDILNTTGDTAATEFTWNTASVTPGVTNWATSTQYAVIKSTITQSGAGVRVYTDNKNGTAYKCTASTTTSYAGLVAKTLPSNMPLPMAWSIKDAKAAGTQVNPQSTTDAVKFASSYFKDKTGLSPINNGEPYCTILNYNGMKFGTADGERGGSGSGTFYFYIAANFASALTPMDYGTETLTFEGYTE